MKSGNVEIVLEPVDRSNYKKLFSMQLRPEQITFVTPPRWTLARCYVRQFGDGFEHLPHLLVTAGREVVGYSTTACDPASDDDYWIDDIMIEASHQGKGYGRAGVAKTIKMILARYPQCRAVRLTCFRANTNAAALYESMGFEPTGEVDSEFGEPNYVLKGAALEKFRTS